MYTIGGARLSGTFISALRHRPELRDNSFNFAELAQCLAICFDISGFKFSFFRNFVVFWLFYIFNWYNAKNEPKKDKKFLPYTHIHKIPTLVFGSLMIRLMLRFCLSLCLRFGFWVQVERFFLSDRKNNIQTDIKQI